ncbi:MAG: hypothetical protein RIQ89_217, partial [Bacteroidota bacterium]
MISFRKLICLVFLTCSINGYAQYNFEKIYGDTLENTGKTIIE